MIRLDVWLTLPSGQTVKAGALIAGDPDPVRGGLQGQFRYAPEYLEHPWAFPLDPLHLSLSVVSFDVNRLSAGVHGVFEDSLPDDWGRRLMIRRHNLGRSEQRVPNLLRLLGNQGLGALSYVEEGRPELKSTGISCRHLQKLALQAQKFEKDAESIGKDIRQRPPSGCARG